MIDEANRIKARLRACASEPEIMAVADEERETVRAMAKAEEGAALAHQIANLKAYLISNLRRTET